MTNDKIESLLDAHATYYIQQTMKFFQENGESPALSKNNPGDLEAKKQILELIVEARLKGQAEAYTDVATWGQGLNTTREYESAAISNRARVDKELAQLQDSPSKMENYQSWTTTEHTAETPPNLATIAILDENLPHNSTTTIESRSSNKETE